MQASELQELFIAFLFAQVNVLIFSVNFAGAKRLDSICTVFALLFALLFAHGFAVPLFDRYYD